MDGPVRKMPSRRAQTSPDIPINSTCFIPDFFKSDEKHKLKQKAKNYLRRNAVRSFGGIKCKFHNCGECELPEDVSVPDLSICSDVATVTTAAVVGDNGRLIPSTASDTRC
ncbi:hypothetical protein LOAG_01556 [Loa loa]|uniref:Uncharacterized protein n=1 Tax=Loa loa TaxID=7209 RepID=A0A1S0UAN0_LOALO|nr:hypothetical protein LOAG_01556 [Loa loa]EFO26931.1 hypothetical protein LOAG_01556 [Loa loa]